MVHTLLLVACLLTSSLAAEAVVCCWPYFPGSPGLCIDGSTAVNGACGVGPCDERGCNCEGGCRRENSQSRRMEGQIDMPADNTLALEEERPEWPEDEFSNELGEETFNSPEGAWPGELENPENADMPEMDEPESMRAFEPMQESQERSKLRQLLEDLLEKEKRHY